MLFRPVTVLTLALLMVLGPMAVPGSAPAGLFGDFTIKDEIELGKKFSTLIKSRMPMIEDPEIKGYVEQMIQRLVAVAPPQPFEVEANVILNNSLNAFAIPGGYTFVYTGLILNFDTEAQLAGVVAHELAHVTQRHVAGQIEKAQIANIMTLAGMLAGVFIGDSDTRAAVMQGSAALGQAAMLNYSREDEREADNVGMNYLVAAGYPPQGLMNGLKNIEKMKHMSGGGSMPAYLSTHPLGKERINYLEQRIMRLSPAQQARKGDDERFKRVQTLVRARYSPADQALAFFRKHLGSSSLNDMGLGIAYARLNRIPEAEHAFSLALDRDPSDPLIHREAGRFFFISGNYSKAAPHLLRAVMLNPADVMALFYYARLMDETGDKSKASEYYKKLLKKLPEDSEVHYYYGRSLGQQGHIFDARLHLFYSALYANNRKKANFNLKKAREASRTEAHKKQIEKAEKDLSSRSEFW